MKAEPIKITLISHHKDDPGKVLAYGILKADGTVESENETLASIGKRLGNRVIGWSNGYVGVSEEGKLMPGASIPPGEPFTFEEHDGQVD